MDEERLYNEWKERRRQVRLPEDFGDRVMARLRRESTHRPATASFRAKAVLVRWAISIGLALLGLIRLSLITHNLLVP